MKTRARAIAHAVRFDFTKEERKAIRIYFGRKKSERDAKGLFAVMAPMRRFFIPPPSKKLRDMFSSRGQVGRQYNLPVNLTPFDIPGDLS